MEFGDILRQIRAERGVLSELIERPPAVTYKLVRQLATEVLEHILIEIRADRAAEAHQREVGSGDVERIVFTD